MLLDGKEKINRALIYFIYDKDGVVDDYIIYMLNEMEKFTSDILVVVNGKLSEDSRVKLQNITNQILVRENIGYDVWAYKTAIEWYGWDKIQSFDEVIMMNFTIFGPIYPFDHMFKTMESKDIDFWGITIFNSVPFDMMGPTRYGYIPTHLQSHFITVRKPMLQSKEFHEYWENMSEINSYNDSVRLHEAIFTKYFSDLGYSWDVYVDTREGEQTSYCPILMDSYHLVTELKCPIIKRRSFYHKYIDFLDNSCGDEMAKTYDYIDQKLNYDASLIWKNILRLENNSNIELCMHKQYVIDDIEGIGEKAKKITVFTILLDENIIPSIVKQLAKLGKNIDVVALSSRQDVANKFQIECKENKVSIKENYLFEQLEKNESLYELFYENINEYDYLCVINNRNKEEIDHTKGFDYVNMKYIENLLFSQSYVSQVIDIFERESSLGMLCPNPLNFGKNYWHLSSYKWNKEIDEIKKFLDKLNLHPKLELDEIPVTCYSSMFWVKTSALKDLFSNREQLKEIVELAYKENHLFNLLYAKIILSQGYYSGYVSTKRNAEIELDNLHYMLSNLNTTFLRYYGQETFHELLDEIKKCYLSQEEASNINCIVERVKELSENGSIDEINDFLRPLLLENMKKEEEDKRLESVLKETQESLHWHIERVKKLEEELHPTQESLHWHMDRVKQLEEVLHPTQESLHWHMDRVKELEDVLQETQESLHWHMENKEKLEEEAKENSLKISSLQRKIFEMENSFSWKVTKFLRKNK